MENNMDYSSRITYGEKTSSLYSIRDTRVVARNQGNMKIFDLSKKLMFCIK